MNALPYQSFVIGALSRGALSRGALSRGECSRSWIYDWAFFGDAMGPKSYKAFDINIDLCCSSVQFLPSGQHGSL